VFTFKSIGLYCCFRWIRGRLRSFVEIDDKGVTVEQVAKVTRNFTSRSYGTCVSYVWLSTQTIQETVDSLEGSSIVRSRSFAIWFWHQFTDAHSPVGMHPEKFGVVKETSYRDFCKYINYKDSTGDHDILFWIKIPI
jgi:hypothetical protein